MPKRIQITGKLPLAALAGLAALAIYVLTLAPDLTWANFGGDGGELITAAVTLGIPHPPGYPTYVLLGHLVSRLPWPVPALGFNLFSAVSMATAVFFLALALQMYGRWPSIAAALAFSLASLVWGQATITEVYALNLAFLAAFLWALTSQKPAWLVGLLLGLSLTTHLTSVFMLPLVLTGRPRTRSRDLLGGLLLGLSPFLLLPLLAKTGSPVVWGDPTTLAGWWWLVSGRIYQPNQLALPADQILPRLQMLGRLLLDQFTLAGIPLGIWGTWHQLRQSREKPSKISLFSVALTIVFYLLYAFFYDAQDAVVLLLPLLLLLSFPLAAGLRPLERWGLFLPLTLLLLHFNAQNLRDDLPVRPLATNTLDQAPADAILLTNGDPDIFTLWYFQHVEGKRSDLVLVDQHLFAFNWYRQRLGNLNPELRGLEVDDLIHFQRANESRRPFCQVQFLPEAAIHTQVKGTQSYTENTLRCTES